MFNNTFLNSSDPDTEKLAKLIDLTTQTSQANDSILREIQDSTSFINITDPKVLSDLVKDGIVMFKQVLKSYDDMTVELASYKALLNEQITGK